MQPAARHLARLPSQCRAKPKAGLAPPRGNGVGKASGAGHGRETRRPEPLARLRGGAQRTGVEEQAGGGMGVSLILSPLPGRNCSGLLATCEESSAEVSSGSVLWLPHWLAIGKTFPLCEPLSSLEM